MKQRFNLDTKQNINIFCDFVYNKLKIGNVIFLKGNLASGKTFFVKNISKFFGIKRNIITSPTYTYLNIYKSKKYNIYHFDLYKIEEKNKIIDLGLLDYINDKNAIKFIEWPEILKNFYIKPNMSLNFVNKNNIFFVDITI